MLHLVSLKNYHHHQQEHHHHQDHQQHQQQQQEEEQQELPENTPVHIFRLRFIARSSPFSLALLGLIGSLADWLLCLTEGTALAPCSTHLCEILVSPCLSPCVRASAPCFSPCGRPCASSSV